MMDQFRAEKLTFSAVADGVHSRLRNIVLESDKYVAKKTGLTCYRIAVSVEDAKKALGNRPLPHWWEPSTCKNRSSIISAADGSARIVTAYPLRHQTYFNLSCILRAEESTKTTTESWNAEGDRAEMMESFGDFEESLGLILGYGFSTPTVDRGLLTRAVLLPKLRCGNFRIWRLFQPGHEVVQCSLEMLPMP
jgi:2-polyprenyl-6-methoxyphenol hydroxylase-like FAD-dependent oxidoreductase